MKLKKTVSQCIACPWCSERWLICSCDDEPTSRAWRVPARLAVGGRAGDGDAVPRQAGRQLHVSLQRDGPGGHVVVARPHLLPPRHRLRRARHPPPRRRRRLPLLPQAPQGGDRHPRRVVERQRLRSAAAGVPHGGHDAARRRLHHQRQAGRLVQLLQREPYVRLAS